MIEITDELMGRLNKLRESTFFEILDMAGRVFIVVDYDESVIIGKRGFLPEEKERGLVLVFNKKMKFNWDKEAITATLVFGNTPEKCYIPIELIAAVFSPDLRIQLVLPVLKKIDKSVVEESTLKENTDKGKVIDITKRKKK